MQGGSYRQRTAFASEKGKGVLNFSSNDYLSLTDDPRIKTAYQRGFARYPTGSGGSMMVCGYHSMHQALEKAFADALGVDDCILFASGYAANLSVIGLLAHFNAPILLDKAVHASFYDGIRLCKARYSRYLHNDMVDLAKKMQQLPENTVLITESIFSMSGQSAPLREIAAYQHDLLVDEAHAFGILGRQGLGAVVLHQLTQAEVPLRMIPLGKAGAASGAIVAGSGIWIDALLQTARPNTYSTAMSPAFAYGLLETLEVVRGADDRRAKLSDLVKYFRDAIKSSPLTWRDSVTPIQQLQLGCPQRALYYAQKLREQGIICLPMRQPTVSKQEVGLRIIFNYHHQPEDIQYLLAWLHQL